MSQDSQAVPPCRRIRSNSDEQQVPMTAGMSLIGLHQQALEAQALARRSLPRSPIDREPMKRQQLIAILDEALDLLDDNTFGDFVGDFPSSAFANNRNGQASN